MITTYVFLQITLLLLAVGGFFQVQQFLRLYPTISSSDDLDHFKKLARVQMYVALIYIGLAIPGILLSMYISMTYGLYGVAMVIGLTIPHFALGRVMSKLENKSRSLNCAPQYAQEHERIGIAWRKRALPNF